MARYGKKTQEKVEKALERFKEGKLKSGKNGKKVASHSQAIALSGDRKKRTRMPQPPKQGSSDADEGGTLVNLFFPF